MRATLCASARYCTTLPAYVFSATALGGMGERTRGAACLPTRLLSPPCGASSLSELPPHFLVLSVVLGGPGLQGWADILHLRHCSGYYLAALRAGGRRLLALSTIWRRVNAALPTHEESYRLPMGRCDMCCGRNFPSASPLHMPLSVYIFRVRSKPPLCLAPSLRCLLPELPACLLLPGCLRWALLPVPFLSSLFCLVGCGMTDYLLLFLSLLAFRGETRSSPPFSPRRGRRRGPPGSFYFLRRAAEERCKAALPLRGTPTYGRGRGTAAWRLLLLSGVMPVTSAGRVCFMVTHVWPLARAACLAGHICYAGSALPLHASHTPFALCLLLSHVT